MTRNKTHALFLVAALAACFAAIAGPVPAAGAQTTPPSSTESQKIIKTEFVVQRMLLQSLQVHSLTDMRALLTFSYSPGLQGKMQKIFNAGGYQYGDKVVVWYRQGTTVALNIKGKPSKKK